MRDNIISYMEMCLKEGASLQRGMNFRLHGRHSVVLMSVRQNSPYEDRVEDDGAVLIYEGHDVPRSEAPIPKNVDQAQYLPSGKPTQNGKFLQAALACKNGEKGPDLVRVYEKMLKGVWSDNGYFQLVDGWSESDGRRAVFKFKLEAVSDVADDIAEVPDTLTPSPGRLIPTEIKREVFKRDGGKCVMCGSKDQLHFDHILPWAKGGASDKLENIQILCARHNLAKSDRIE
jgi:hypothetical protein